MRPPTTSKSGKRESASATPLKGRSALSLAIRSRIVDKETLPEKSPHHWPFAIARTCIQKIKACPGRLVLSSAENIYPKIDKDDAEML
jgi:hypothetical protein